MAWGFSTCHASLKTGERIPRNPHKCWVGVAACLPTLSQKAEMGILEQDCVETSHIGEFGGLIERDRLSE